MCGFVGFSGFLENKNEILQRMMDRIIHRGPDMAGQFFSPDGKVALGFRRLSIIDLSEAGNQPMVSESGGMAVTFNGEIYNFMELRRELEAMGHTFRTKGDTEVVLRGYMEWGEALPGKLRGMFAFVIYDGEKDLLFGARDYFGIKPFYYQQNGEELIFGSEIKAFLEHPRFKKEVNENALRAYLTFQYSAQEECFFKGVYKLPPAHQFVFSDGKMTVSPYWDADFAPTDHGSFEECAKELDSVIRESVAAHKISDVKIGAFLSGGIDSSYITACMMPDKSFSVGFDYDKFNETNYAKELSDILGIENYCKMLTADECFDAFSDIQYHMDEPQSNPSSVPLYFLAKLASEQVTVVLSGEGADEIFAGYEWYDETPMMRKYKKLPGFLRRAAAKVAKGLPYFKGHDFIIKGSGVPEDYFIGQALVFPEKEAVAVLQDKYRGGRAVKDITAEVYKRVKGKDELTKKQYLDLKLWMPGDILLKADKMSMAHSLELRVPFLDRKVMEMAQTIESDYKITREHTKHILRKASCHTVGEDWVNRPKKGFPVPIRYWLREERYYNLVKEAFTADYAGEFFHTDRLLQLLDEHRGEKANHGRKIWTVFTFLVWYKRFFIDEK